MRNNGKKMIVCVCYIIVGAVLMVLSLKGIIGNIYNGFGAGLIGAGVALLYKHIRYQNNPEYKEKVDVEIADERNSFIRVKAWSWAAYLFVLISAAATVVFMIMDQTEKMMMASFGVCLVLILYVASYYVLRRKY